MHQQIGLTTILILSLHSQPLFAQQSTYRVIDGKFTWHEARADAESRGGHLATVTSLNEHEEIVRQIGADAFSPALWLGATDEEQEGKWKWITNEPFVYTHWNRFSPNNSAHNRGWPQNYLIYTEEQLWDDAGDLAHEMPRIRYLLEIPAQRDAKAVPSVRTLTKERRNELGLYQGVQGVELLTDFRELKAGIVIESLFHRAMPTEEAFRKAWQRGMDGGQFLVGFWKVARDGSWVRDTRMVAVPDFHAPPTVRQNIKGAVEALRQPHSAAVESLRTAKTAYKEQLARIASRAGEMKAPQLAEAIAQARDDFDRVTASPEIVAMRGAVLNIVEQTAPLAQRILIQTVQASVEDRDALVVNIAAATVTGGASVAPMLVDTAISASFEVLSEEGILTEDQARVLRGASTLLHALNGIQDVEDALTTLGAVRDAYSSLIEVGVIDEEQLDPTVRARIRSGSEVLDILIKLKE